MSTPVPQKMNWYAGILQTTEHLAFSDYSIVHGVELTWLYSLDPADVTHFHAGEISPIRSLLQDLYLRFSGNDSCNGYSRSEKAYPAGMKRHEGVTRILKFYLTSTCEIQQCLWYWYIHRRLTSAAIPLQWISKVYSRICFGHEWCPGYWYSPASLNTACWRTTLSRNVCHGVSNFPSELLILYAWLIMSFTITSFSIRLPGSWD